jgi:hypothetical protein
MDLEDENSPSGVADLAVYDTAALPHEGDEASTEVYTDAFSDGPMHFYEAFSDGPMGAAAPEPEGNQDADEQPWEYDSGDTGQGHMAAYYTLPDDQQAVRCGI